jgi:hypothetical protein
MIRDVIKQVGEDLDDISASQIDFIGFRQFKRRPDTSHVDRAIQREYDQVLGDRIRVMEQTTRVERLETWSAKWWKAIGKLDRLNAQFLYSVKRFDQRVILR